MNTTEQFATETPARRGSGELSSRVKRGISFFDESEGKQIPPQPEGFVVMTIRKPEGFVVMTIQIFSVCSMSQW